MGASHRAKNRFNRKRVAAFAVSFLTVLSLVMVPFSAAYAADANVVVVAVDKGHGNGDSGATYNGMTEDALNTKIGDALIAELATYQGVKVIETTRYSGRLDRINSVKNQNPDVLVSVHCNSSEAADAKGVEVYVPNDSAYRYNESYVWGKALGEQIISRVAALGLTNRGVKTRSYTNNDNSASNFYPSPGGLRDYYGIIQYPRLNGFFGVLVEHAFMSNASDAAFLKNDANLKKLGVADATGIAAFYNLQKKSATPAGPQPSVPSSNANDYNKVGKVIETKVATGKETDPAIMGQTKLQNSDQLAAWYIAKAGQNTYPSSTYEKYGAATIYDFCRILWEEAKAEGVRPEVLMAQVAKETGWLKFGGHVQADWCNFGGIGAEDNAPEKTAIFNTHGKDSVRIGLRAQVQHLKAYADANPQLVNDRVDPRFNLVSPKGKAPTVSKLTGTWATDTTYGTELTRLINELLTHAGAVGTVPATADIAFETTSSNIGTNNTTKVSVDGVECTVDASGKVTIPNDGKPHTITSYTYTSASPDAEGAYPLTMEGWIVTPTSSGYTTQRIHALDNLLVYQGSSIRTTGNQGLRMVTGLGTNLKKALSSSGAGGLTLVETGTLLAWADSAGMSATGPTIDMAGVSKGQAYVKGQKDPIFTSNSSLQTYTNVVTLKNATAAQIKRTMAMRPYAILQDAKGNRYTVYGGTVYRSIQYIAKQNANTFTPGSAAYNYVQSLIDPK